MYALEKLKTSQKSLEANLYALCAYEHLEVLVPTEERAGHRPVKLKRNSVHGGNIGNIGAVSGARILKTRKRRDGKVKESLL